MWLPEAQTEAKLSCSESLFFAVLYVRISVSGADGGRGCLAMMTVDPDG